ncbi:MAG: glycosyltransferase family 9 protein, partial [Planctomycetota bacterium]
IHRLPRGAWKRSAASRSRKLADLQRLYRRLRACHYDAVIDAQGLAKSALLAAGAGARLRISHDRRRAREGAWLIGQRHGSSIATHVIDQQRALGIPLLGSKRDGGWRFPLPAWNQEHDWAQSFLADHDLQRPWTLNVGAGWPTKVWPVERQREFCQRLLAEGERPLVVWGSPDERQIAETIAAAAPGTVVAPSTTIPQLAALLARAGVVVSGDTGPLHLARAMGSPALGLFGPVPAERNGPRGPGAATLQAPGAAWERKDVSKVDMGAISVDQVLAVARPLRMMTGPWPFHYSQT